VGSACAAGRGCVAGAALAAVGARQARMGLHAMHERCVCWQLRVAGLSLTAGIMIIFGVMPFWGTFRKWALYR